MDIQESSFSSSPFQPFVPLKQLPYVPVTATIYASCGTILKGVVCSFAHQVKFPDRVRPIIG